MSQAESDLESVNNRGFELTMFSLKKMKKIWKKEVERIQCISPMNSGIYEVIFRSNGDYVVGVMDSRNAEIVLSDMSDD